VEDAAKGTVDGRGYVVGHHPVQRGEEGVRQAGVVEMGAVGGVGHAGAEEEKSDAVGVAAGVVPVVISCRIAKASGRMMRGGKIGYL
jgi:hypothetical protein